jgi:hypothetical protein
MVISGDVQCLYLNFANYCSTYVKADLLSMFWIPESGACIFGQYGTPE